jgi:hypothetical protein
MTTGLLTIIDDYITAVLRHAIVKLPEDQSGEQFVEAEVEGYPMIRAHGDTVEACRDALAEVIEDWVRKWLRQGHDLPLVEGIDLNSVGARVLERYHRYVYRPTPGLERVFQSEGEFIAHLEQLRS